GNAVGMGNADLVHERFYRKVDLGKTYINARTSLKPSTVRLPMHLASDREALDIALGSIGSPAVRNQRIAWVRNTLNLERIFVSEALSGEAANLPGWRLSQGGFEPQFDTEENLLSPAVQALSS
ncbi:MAG TPA: hypothetical protein VFZ08_13130, partial [Terriglobia bacterium]|nr:hypothetical protein [Terriglobia bacterium]